MIYDLHCFPQISVIILKPWVMKLLKGQNQDKKHRLLPSHFCRLVRAQNC